MWTAALARDRGGRKYHPDASHDGIVTEATYPRLQCNGIMSNYGNVPEERRGGQIRLGRVSRAGGAREI